MVVLLKCVSPNEQRMEDRKGEVKSKKKCRMKRERERESVCVSE